MARSRAVCLCGISFEGDVVDGPLCSPHIVCPRCGKDCVVGEIKSYEVHAGNANFFGSKSFSLMQGCHPSEVKLLKKIVGADFESCVKDDGTVKFKNRKQERAYVAAFERARAINAADPGCFARRGHRPD